MVPQRLFFSGKPRLGAIPRLNLALLIDAEHDGMFGRVQAEAHNGLEF